MAAVQESRRPNQRARTRKDLLQAAARLMNRGRKPGLEEIAEEALVSRATAYRYFPDVEALLLEASLDIAIPDSDTLFRDGSPDPVARLDVVDATFHDMMRANESALRMMLAYSLQRELKGGLDKGLPARQNRRTPLIEAALEPGRSQFKPSALKTLTRALALFIGTLGWLQARERTCVSNAARGLRDADAAPLPAGLDAAAAQAAIARQARSIRIRAFLLALALTALLFALPPYPA